MPEIKSKRKSYREKSNRCGFLKENFSGKLPKYYIFCIFCYAVRFFSNFVEATRRRLMFMERNKRRMFSQILTRRIY